MAKVEFFSEGKNEGKNEDYFNYNENNFVLADGATDKSGRKYNGQTGGEIISRLLVKEVLDCALNGVELVNYLNNKIAQLYIDLGIDKDIHDPKFRFTCSLTAVRIIGEKIIITYVGDPAFRVNGKYVHQKIKQLDIDNANIRAEYIERTGDVVGSRDYIMPLLLKQFQYQNNPNNALGYGAIDGTVTPEKFIEVFEYSLDEIKTIELFTDGYYAIPNDVAIEAWEDAFKKGELEDPDKFKKYKSTKSKDDRTIAIIKF